MVCCALILPKKGRLDTNPCLSLWEGEGLRKAGCLTGCQPKDSFQGPGASAPEIVLVSCVRRGRTCVPGPWPRLSLLPSSGSRRLGVGQAAAWQVGQAGELWLCLGTAAGAMTLMVVCDPWPLDRGWWQPGLFHPPHYPAHGAISDSPAAALSPRTAGLGRRSVSGTAPRRELRGAAARPAAPLRPPGRGRTGGPRSRPAEPVGRGCAVRRTRRVPPGWRGSWERPASPTMCCASSAPTTACRRGSSPRCCSAWEPRPPWARSCRSPTCTTTRYRHRGGSSRDPGWERPGARAPGRLGSSVAS